jgi:cleavage stimulation factor subunit 3
VNGGVHTGGQFRPQASATPLPRDIVYLLSIIPPASAYNVGRFVPEKIIELIRRVDIPSSISQLRPPPQPVHNIGIPIAGIQPYTSKS